MIEYMMEMVCDGILKFSALTRIMPAGWSL